MQGRSRINHKNVPSSTKGMPSIPHDVLCLVAVTPWGPMGEYVSVTSFPDWEQKFGRYMANYHSAVQAELFFRGKGRKIIVSRVCHWNPDGTPDTAAKASKTFNTGAGSPTYGTVTGTVEAPFALADGDTIIVSHNGDDGTTATFNAASATLTSGTVGPFNIPNGSTIGISVNGGTAQRVTFSETEYTPGAATAAQVAAIFAAQLTGVSVDVVDGYVVISTDRKGTGASLNVVESGGGPYGTDANAVLTFPVATQTGTGDAADADSVTLAELKTLIEGDVANVTVGSSGSYLTIRTNTAGTGGSIQVLVASTADAKIGLDNASHAGIAGGATATLKIEGLYYGTLGNELSVLFSAAASGDTSRFDLKLYRTGYTEPLESWSDCTMDSTDDKYIVDVLNNLSSRSKWIRATDMAAAGTATQRMPDRSTYATAQYLTGGDDGLTGLVDADWIGTATYQTGLHAFSRTEEGDRLCCPDNTSVTFQNAATAYCEGTKGGKLRFLPDPPASCDEAAIVEHQAALTASESRAGLIWPRVKIVNPDQAIYGKTDTITVAPAVLHAARAARNSQEDEKLKMWKQPSNQYFGLLDNACGLETEDVLNPDVQDRITDAGINPIVAGLRIEDGLYGVWVNDCMAGKRTGNFTTNGENAGVAYLRKKFEQYLEIHRTQGNSEESRAKVEDDFEAELAVWTEAGAFMTKDVTRAFYVDADIPGATINNPVVQNNEQFQVLVGIATAKAQRMQDILFTRDARAVNSYLQKLMSATSTT